MLSTQDYYNNVDKDYEILILPIKARVKTILWKHDNHHSKKLKKIIPLNKSTSVPQASINE